MPTCTSASIIASVLFEAKCNAQLIVIVIIMLLSCYVITSIVISIVSIVIIFSL